MDGHWAAAVAGHVEKGESVFDAAVREAVEEVDLTDVHLMPLCMVHRTGNGRRACGLLLRRHGLGWAARIVEPDKWADPAQARPRTPGRV